ncbi:hypothetical protein HW555_007123 [Spodoptera exigua]|uniref:Complexin n=1 Tax=Spodoptera exigua TaxID=7107 RepID=A0A835L3X4_SPOEX|nr:hypothetical protein HW555_007123 [Spodoptera exigua]
MYQAPISCEEVSKQSIDKGSVGLVGNTSDPLGSPHDVSSDNKYDYMSALILLDRVTWLYKIPKKEEVVEQQQAEPDNPLMRKKKTPEELAAEAELEDQDEFTKLKNTIETQVNELKSQIESKCVMQ